MGGVASVRHPYPQKLWLWPNKVNGSRGMGGRDLDHVSEGGGVHITKV